MDRIMMLIQEFFEIYFRHIYWAFNDKADGLSKKSINNMDSHLFYEESRDGIVLDFGFYNIFLPLDQFFFRCYCSIVQGYYVLWNSLFHLESIIFCNHCSYQGYVSLRGLIFLEEFVFVFEYDRVVDMMAFKVLTDIRCKSLCNFDS